jgi:hypothetical protein
MVDFAMLKYLGKVEMDGSGGTHPARNNTNTATPFEIPKGAREVVVWPSANAMAVELLLEPVAVPTVSTLDTDATKGFPLGDPGSTPGGIAIRLPCSKGQRNVLCCYNGDVAAKNIRVWVAE